MAKTPYPPTLAKIAPDAYARVRPFNSLPVGQVQEISSLIADFISKASLLDAQLAELMLQAGGSETGALVAEIFTHLKSTPAQKAAITAAITHRLDYPAREKFSDLLDMISDAQHKRNAFAHWIPCECGVVSDHVLLMNPKDWLPRAATSFQALEMLPGNLTRKAAVSLDPSGIPNTFNDKIYAFSYWYVSWEIYKISEAAAYLWEFKHHLIWA